MEKIILFFKNIGLKEWFLMCLTFLSPIQPLIFLCFFLILLDLFFGIQKAIKRGEKITSKGLYETGKKIYIYNMIIISTFILDYYFLNEFIQIFFDKIKYLITKLIAAGALVTEVQSIRENIKILYDIDIFIRLKNIVFKFFTIKKDFDKFSKGED
jgi:4-hydroxybenzoate polyprenyltransferase